MRATAPRPTNTASPSSSAASPSNRSRLNQRPTDATESPGQVRCDGLPASRRTFRRRTTARPARSPVSASISAWRRPRCGDLSTIGTLALAYPVASRMCCPTRERCRQDQHDRLGAAGAADAALGELFGHRHDLGSCAARQLPSEAPTLMAPELLLRQCRIYRHSLRVTTQAVAKDDSPWPSIFSILARPTTRPSDLPL